MATTVVYYNGVRNIVFEIQKPSGGVVRQTILGSGAGLSGTDAKVLPGRGAYGITEVNSDVWSEIKKQYGGMEIFKKGFICDGATKKEQEAAKAEVSALDNGQAPAKPEAAEKKKK